MKGRSKNSLSSFSNDEKPDKTELKAENRQLAGSLDKMTAAFTALSKGDMPKNSGITPKGPLNTAISSTRNSQQFAKLLRIVAQLTKPSWTNT
jgi:hypothetical protein